VTATPLISVVAPAYNEAEILREFHARVTAALAGEDYELMIVDDGSTDGTGHLLERLAEEDPRVRPVFLSRNFGHQAAVTAGVDAARASVVVSIDADLQDPPEVIPRLLEAWREGWDVVHAVRHVRPGETRLRLAAIRTFYRLFTRIGGLQDFPGNSGDFRLIAGPALEALRALPERNRFVRGLVSWVGYRQTSIVYERDARYAGASKYPLRKLLRLGADAVTSFSTLPLHLSIVVGIGLSVIAFLAIPLIVVLKLAGLYDVSGIASITVLILLLGGIQLVFLGLIGEYLGRTYDEGKQRPVYLTSTRPRSAAVPDGD
jgi:polyisoprenyl-phosphate glycosyltransferase